MKIEEKFIEYEKILKEWSTKINLVAPSTLSEIKTRHIMDSAQLAQYIPKDVNIIDLGSGAGFPGAVLAIMGWNVTCIESIGKKTKFLTEFFGGKMPQSAESFKDSKDIIERLIYDAYLIRKDDWKSVYKRQCATGQIFTKKCQHY